MKKYTSITLAAVMILLALSLASCASDGQLVYSETEGGWSVSVIRYPFFSALTLEIPEEYQGTPVVEIASGGFSGSDGFFGVSIPGSIKIIPSYAFGSCENLLTVEIARGVERIESYAFANCESLYEITLPSSIEYIGSGALGLCYSLETVKFDGTVDRWHAIEKASDWCEGIAENSLAVSCTDGVVIY